MEGGRVGGGIMLQLAVQSVEWTYSLYWHFSIHQRMLVWGDGFYNGAIKTTKTLHPAASSTATAASSSQAASHHHHHLIHRTHQLRDLYSSLSAGLRRPNYSSAAALSPEDLTHSEWFYLLSLSFSFPPGLGLPGKAFANKQHVWITGANDIDTKIFSRAILAKSADIKTVVCIPLMDGVVELGTTDKVNEDIGFIQHIKSIILSTAERRWAQVHSESSELSTSDSGATSSLDQYYYYYYNDNYNNRKQIKEKQMMNSDSSTSNNTDGDGDGDGDGELIMIIEPISEGIFGHGRLQHEPQPDDIACTAQSAFSKWTTTTTTTTRRSDDLQYCLPTTTISQCFLKYILYTVPFLHTTTSTSTKHHHHHHHNPFKSKCCSTDIDDDHELVGNGQSFLVGRSPTQKLINEKFMVLRSIVRPLAGRKLIMDQTSSILGDTVEYLKHLRQKIQNLEADQNRDELEKKLPRPPILTISSSSNSQDYNTAANINNNLQVSIIGSEGLNLELQCPYREGLLLDILHILQGLRIETTSVSSSISTINNNNNNNNNGRLLLIITAHLRAKVKENMQDGKKASILEAVKRAIQQIIPCPIHSQTNNY